MKPEKVTFYVYAESAEKAALLQDELHNFVMTMYEAGVLVTAERLADLVHRFGGSQTAKILFNG